MALPNTNISVAMVKAELGASTNNVGQLCIHPNINKWSKCKPVKQPHINVDGLLDWWKAFDGKCGLNIPVYTSAGAITTVGSFLHSLKNKTYDWEYVKPIGGTTSPYRLADFRNYERSAVMPIASMPSYNAFVDINNNIQIELEVIVEYPDAYNLTLQDINHQGVDMTNYYLGVMLYKPTNNTFIIGTSQSKISTGDLTIILNDMGSNAGTWKAAFFMSSVALAQGGTFPVANYIPIDIPHVDVTVHSTGGAISIDIYGMWNNLNKAINYGYNIYNSGGSSRTVTGIQCVLVHTTNLQEPSEGTVVTTQSQPDETVPANSIITISNKTFTHTRIENRTYWIGTSAVGIPMTYNQVEDNDEM